MVSTSQSTTRSGGFHFISVQTPNDAKDPIARGLARSHAVKCALENKRKLQQESGDIFRLTPSADKPRRVANKRRITVARAASPFSLSAGALDPFKTLAVDSSRLQTLLGNCKLHLALWLH